MKSAPEGIEIYPIFVSDQSRQYMRTLISILWISFFPLAAAAQDDDLSYRLKKVIKDKKAEIGIAVILDAQDTVTVNNDDRYPLMSVFKFHQALAVADYLDRNGLTPDTEIFIPEEELVPDTYSPLRDEFPEGGIPISFRSLLEYSMQLSDNNACDILFKHTGGPAATDRYVRSLGLRNFAIAATEQQMHDDPQTCYENWSTPLEAAALLELLVTEQILTPTLREMIRQNLINCKTGADRLPKPLSGTGAVIGHKTGTSDRDERGIFAGTNDPGFVILPDGTRYTIAVFIKDSAENPETNARIIADISETVYRYVHDEYRENDIRIPLITLPTAFRQLGGNELIDSIGILKPFWEKLRMLRLGIAADTVRIVHVGDSHIRGHIFPETTGGLLQRTFGALSYTDMGINGAFCTTFTRPDRVADIAALHPDLVILSFGTNESHNRRYNSILHYRQMEELVCMLRKSLPDVPMLMTTPPGSYDSFRQRRRRRTYKINPRTAVAAQTIRRFADANGLAVWDMYETFGGVRRACLNWQEARLMRPDHVHYLPEGYALQGEMFYRALLKAYNDYCSQ